MLKETRDLRLFPMSPEQFKQFQKHARKQKILFSAIHDRDGKGKVIDVVMPVTELDRANLIFEHILYQGTAKQAPERDDRAASGGREAPQWDRERPEVMPQKRILGRDETRPIPEPGPLRPKLPTGRGRVTGRPSWTS